MSAAIKQPSFVWQLVNSTRVNPLFSRAILKTRERKYETPTDMSVAENKLRPTYFHPADWTPKIGSIQLKTAGRCGKMKF